MARRKTATASVTARRLRIRQDGDTWTWAAHESIDGTGWVQLDLEDGLPSQDAAITAATTAYPAAAWELDLADPAAEARWREQRAAG